MSLLVLVAAVAILDMLAYWFGVDSRRLQPVTRYPIIC
jgi:hypothetical protein